MNVSVYARLGAPSAHQFATASRAMVSTSHPLATEAALDILRRGGSAADACVAAAATQVVVEPPMTTFGGMFMMNWFDAQSGRTTLNMGWPGRPQAEDGKWDEAGADSGRTAPVPGWLNGAQKAWQRFGRLKWAELFEHAYRHALEGFVIDPSLWGWVVEYRYKLARFPEGQKIWYPHGSLLQVGDRLVQTDLARTIRQIQADETLEEFYKGEFAAQYVARIRDDGGRITLEDMARHCGSAFSEEAPIVGRYRGYDIHAPRGYLIALALQAIEHGDLRRAGRPIENPESLYLQMRLMEELWHEGLAAGQMHAATVAAGGKDVGVNLTSPDRAREVWQRVLKQPSRPFDPLHPGTNALIIADAEGNVAFATHSCSCHPFGNGHFINGVWASRALLLYGQPAPVPAGFATVLLLAREGKAHLAVGSPSVSCVSNILQNTMNVVEFGMSLKESVQQPMFGAPWYPSRRARIEGNFPEAAYEHLRRRGMGFQRVSPDECEMGSCQAVQIDHDRGVLHGAADPRRRGQAAGL